MSTQPTRAELIQAAREMLNWLDTHPDAPINDTVLSISVPLAFNSDDAEGMAQLEVFAAYVGGEVTDRNEHGYSTHPRVVVEFGPLSYDVYHVLRSYKDEYVARTYEGSVQPEVSS